MYMITIFAAESFAPMLLFYTIIWFLMRKKDEKLKLSFLWYFAGLIVSLLLAGAVRYALITIFGYAPALNASKDALWQVFFVIPVIVSIIVSAFIRTRYKKITESNSN